MYQIIFVVLLVRESFADDGAQGYFDVHILSRPTCQASTCQRDRIVEQTRQMRIYFRKVVISWSKHYRSKLTSSVATIATVKMIRLKL